MLTMIFRDKNMVSSGTATSTGMGGMGGMTGLPSSSMKFKVTLWEPSSALLKVMRMAMEHWGCVTGR
jgi:hypothetical protein